MTQVRWMLTSPLGACVLLVAGCAPLSGRSGPPALEPAAVFEHRADFATGRNPWAIAVADLNRDGALDLVVVNQTAKSGSVLLGNGDGTFGPRTDFVTGRGPVALALADLNRDGILDLAVANIENTVSIFLGNGDGTFDPKTDFLTRDEPWALATRRDATPENYAANALERFGGNVDEAIKWLNDFGAEGSAKGFLRRMQRKGAEIKKAEGALYKADLPDEWIPKMLDWDKPLSQQPENVRLLAQDLGLAKGATGKDIYYALSNQARDMGIIKGQTLQTTLPGSQEKAAADLMGFGVPGIRYMDGGSRMTPTQEESIKKALERAMPRGDEGVANNLRAQLENRTSNYVVFPGLEDQVKILERNGIPLTGLLGGQ